MGSQSSRSKRVIVGAYALGPVYLATIRCTRHECCTGRSGVEDGALLSRPRARSGLLGRVRDCIQSHWRCLRSIPVTDSPRSAPCRWTGAERGS